jgi:protein-disulfide isomerase
MPNAAVPTRRQALTLAGAAALALALAPLPFARARAQESREIAEMAMGDPDAQVTVIEYASLTCPHCAAFHADVLPLLRENFIDTGQVRLVYREVFFDRPGLWAAMIARCAGEDRFFGVIDLMFQNQADWARQESATDVVQALHSIGRQAGMSNEAMDACLQDEEFARALVANYQANAEEHDITATPSFVINGEKVGNMGYADFEARLNQELG